MGKSTTPAKTAFTDTSKLPSPPKDDIVHDIVHVVGYEVVTLQDDDEIETVARSTLMSTLESAEHGIAGSHNAYGNPRGLDVLADRHDQRRRLASLEDWKAESKTRIASQEIKFASQEAETKKKFAELHHKIHTLSLASEGYRKVRRRFLDVYRRDVRNDVDPQGRQNIVDGNEAAHNGDAVTDAALYNTGERRDHAVITELYGLHPVDIASLAKADDFEAIKVLDAHATWKVKQSVPPDVAAAFATFVKELGWSQSFSKDRCTDGVTPLSRAYSAFWDANKAAQAAHKAALKAARKGD